MSDRHSIPWYNAHRSAVLYAAAAVILVLLCFAAFLSPSGAWPLAAAGVFIVLIANLDRVSEFSASATGFTAKMREAQHAVNDMRSMIELMSKMQLYLLQQSGRWSGPRDDLLENYRKQFVSMMEQSGVASDRISMVQEEVWNRYIRFDYVSAILGGGMLPKNPEAEAEWRKLVEFEQDALPSQLASFLARYGDKSEMRQSLLKAYEYFREHGSHLDWDLYKRRHEAGQLQ